MQIKRSDGRVVGIFKEGVYETTRKQKDHYYWLGKGYPIDVSVLEQLEALSCHTIVINEILSDYRTRKHYFTLEQYLNASEFHHPPYEPQKCVPLEESEGTIETTGTLDWW